MASHPPTLAVGLSLALFVAGCQHGTTATEAPSAPPKQEFSPAKDFVPGKDATSKPSSGSTLSDPEWDSYGPQARRDLRCVASRCRTENANDPTVRSVASIRFEPARHKASTTMVSPGPEKVGPGFIDCLQREVGKLDGPYMKHEELVVTIPVFGADHPVDCESSKINPPPP